MSLTLSMFSTVHITIIIVSVGYLWWIRSLLYGLKTNIKVTVLKWKRRLPMNILSDCEIELTGFYTPKSYPETIRLVVGFGDWEDEWEFVFPTNAKHIPDLQFAELYKNRCLVEQFFKWLKQHHVIKDFFVSQRTL